MVAIQFDYGEEKGSVEVITEESSPMAAGAPAVG